MPAGRLVADPPNPTVITAESPIPFSEIVLGDVEPFIVIHGALAVTTT